MIEVQLKGGTDVTNSDLEALSHLIAFLVVATNAPAKDQTLTIFCHNAPAVG